VTSQTHSAAKEVRAKGTWQGSAVDRVELDYDARFRRRILLTCLSGREVMLDLPKATVLNQGDGLVTEDGIVEVRAAPEKLAEITALDQHHLVRIAWHLGNRHLPTEVVPTEIDGLKLRIREDHVIIDMAKKLGADVAMIEAPFNPEGGAYGHGRTHDHGHGHGHDRLSSHDHGHDHGDDPETAGGS
jgi:urease accessory protein